VNWEFLNRNAGNRLTPEMIQGLSNSIALLMHDTWRDGYDKAMESVRQLDGGGLKLQGDGEFHFNEYTFRVVSYGKARDKLRPLQELHAAEVDTSRGLVPVISDEELLARESLGQLVTFSLWIADDMVGYMTVIISKYPGLNSVIASEMHFFVHSEHRKGWLSIRFIRWIESILKAGGISEFRVGSRSIKDISPIYTRLKYQQLSTVFSKVL